MDRDAMLEFYVFETMEQLTQLENIALHTEVENSIEKQIDEVFRIVHTIKGSSAIMEYTNIVKLAHALEDVFYDIRENNPDGVNYSLLTDIVLKSIDFIKVEISLIQCGENPQENADRLLIEIEKFLAMNKQKEKAYPTAETVSVNKPLYIEKPLINENQYKAVIFFEEGCEMENIRAFNIIYNLEKSSSIINYFPHDITERQETAQKIQISGFEVNFCTSLSYEDVKNLILRTLFVRELKLEKIGRQNSDMKLSDQREADNESGTGNTKQTMISVNIAKMDRLMDLVGELVISQSMVIQNPELEGLHLNGFHKASRQLQLVTNDIQDAVMSIRMVSLSVTFQRMNRIVRDMSKKLNKEIQLEMIGEHTEVDKNIIEHLSDPLLHLVRNAADHGIETTDCRVRAGKSPTGKITLEAKNEGGDVRIIITDDGRGLDRESIIRNAKQQGLLPKPEKELTDKEVYSFILLPGFSTSDKITEYSGRGVGMDVVNQNIKEIGGSLQIDSCLGKYTSITIKIPLTLAIIDGMKIRVGNAIYIIPITTIRESFRISDHKIIRDEADHNEMIMIRGNCYPLLRLYQYFKIPSDVTELKDGIIVVVENGSKCMCLFADELLGVSQAVIKALPNYIKKHKGISSCTVIGNGNVSLIIDVPGLFECVYH